MRAPQNRKSFVVGYGTATPLGKTFDLTWEKAIKGEAGFRKVTRCEVDSPCDVVGEIPDWDPLDLGFTDEKMVYNWNAAFCILTMAVCEEALKRAGLEMDEKLAPRTACMIGSSLNGQDAYRAAYMNLVNRGPRRISPYLLPNLCANLPSGNAGILLGFTGPVYSPQAACASGNYTIGLGSRMIRDGDCDVVLAGGVDTPIIPEIIHGFANMNATIKVREGDRAFDNHSLASRPYSGDRKGFVLSEGAGVVLLVSENVIDDYGLTPLAEVMGVGWSSDAYHFTKPNTKTIVRAIKDAIDDAELSPSDIQYINAHGTSTIKGDSAEIACLKEVFGQYLKSIPVTSNKSQMGHTLGGSASIEASLTIEGMQKGVMLPTINYLPDPLLDQVDVVPDKARKQSFELALSNAFGFGGTNSCIVFRGI